MHMHYNSPCFSLFSHLDFNKNVVINRVFQQRYMYCIVKKEKYKYVQLSDLRLLV